MAICTPAVPGAAEAVKQSGRTDVKVIGLRCPTTTSGTSTRGSPTASSSGTRDLGYLTVHAAHALATGTLAPGTAGLEAGRLGRIEVRGDQVLLGKPFVFTKENIDGFDFLKRRR